MSVVSSRNINIYYTCFYRLPISLSDCAVYNTKCVDSNFLVTVNVHRRPSNFAHNYSAPSTDGLSFDSGLNKLEIRK